MFSLSSFAVKPFCQKCAAEFRKVFKSGFRHIQSAKPCQIMCGLFPRTHIVFIFPRWEFCDPKRTVRCLYRSLRTRTAERGTGLYQLVQPFFLQCGFFIFKISGRLFQGAQCSPRRRSSLFVVRQKRSVRICFETDRTHTGFVIYSEQIVSGIQLAWLAAFSVCRKALSSVHKNSAPPVRRCIGKDTESHFLPGRILPSLYGKQIRIQNKSIAMPSEPFFFKFERMMFGSSGYFNIQPPQKNRFFRTEIFININCIRHIILPLAHACVSANSDPAMFCQADRSAQQAKDLCPCHSVHGAPKHRSR